MRLKAHEEAIEIVSDFHRALLDIAMITYPNASREGQIAIDALDKFFERVK